MDKAIVTNRKALHDYSVIESVEAGLQLKGTEVKSIRAGGTNLTDSFARLDRKGPDIRRLRRNIEYLGLYK